MLSRARVALCRLRRLPLVQHGQLIPKCHIYSSAAKLLKNPYHEVREMEGYSKIKELEKFERLLDEICNIEEHDVLRNNRILESTEYFNLHFGQFQHESINFESIQNSLSTRDYLVLFDAAITTHCIHLQSRLAAFEGKGYYTIGPCGEECMAPIGLLLKLTDSAAFHYRHLAANLSRNMKRQNYDGTQLYSDAATLSNIVRDRARGYVVSTKDPISGGGHCLLGSTDFDYDYLVTSTLASQAGPATGRALGTILYNTLKLPDPKFPPGSVSFVSVGDGSVNNSHFLSAVNLVDYAVHHNVKVPLLMAISNNRMCISLRDRQNWLFTYINKLLHFKKFKCDGNNMFDVYQQFKTSLEYVRKTQKPALIVVDELKRQFGHAATDRQDAYLSSEEVEMLANNDLLLKLCKQYIKLGVFDSKMECLERLLFISNLVKEQFESVYDEPKLENTPANRQLVKRRNSAPLVPYTMKINTEEIKQKLNRVISDNGIRTKSVMRKGMIYAIEEVLNLYPNSVYVGEDVSHGGYYLVTDGLSAKYPLRIRDFPPDETALFGVGVGYAQSGLLPIVEMPYAKYLDCGADMFFEAIVMNWLSNGNQPNGVLFRLQGFGNGLFGGNFHTHNSLYIPPGLDVVCYFCGSDYINGWRYNMQQVANGRCVMSVDCTQQLNNRHVYGDQEKDGLLLTNIPDYNEYITFNDIFVYNNKREKYCIYDSDESCQDRMVLKEAGYLDIRAMRSLYDDGVFVSKKKKHAKGVTVAVITYGLGINVSRQAQHELLLKGGHADGIADILVIDTPYLSDVAQQLKLLLSNDRGKKEIDCIVFADMCKEGQNPLNGIIAKLQQQNILQNYSWMSCAAQYTYNPLGKDLTFLSKDDVMQAIHNVVDNHTQSLRK